MSGSPIERYLAALARELPRLGRGRVLAEAEDHLREAARDGGEEQAVARFGPPSVVARALAPVRSTVWSRLAGATAILAALSFPAAYPTYERSLPPAPWPSAAAMPAHLVWKRELLFVLLLATVAAALGALLRAPLARGALLVVPTALGLTWVVLTVQWADAVSGTPGRLVALALAQLGVCVVPAFCAARSLVLARAASAAG